MAKERRPPAASPKAAPASAPQTADGEPRRGFMTKFTAALVGTVVGVVPILAAGVTFLDPLIRKRKSATAGSKGESAEGTASDGFLPITTVQNLATDGTPRMFPVVTDLQDAWNKFPDTEIGSVYLWQAQDGTVGCFNARCPHLGCTVNYKSDVGAYVCPCHDSAFALDGVRSNDIPPRDMDKLAAEVRGDEVWVKFQKFRAGIHEQEVV